MIAAPARREPVRELIHGAHFRQFTLPRLAIPRRLTHV
jgi:hypothetical protein